MTFQTLTRLTRVIVPQLFALLSACAVPLAGVDWLRLAVLASVSFFVGFFVYRKLKDKFIFNL